MLLLFVKGDRGLMANGGSRFYFPDRNSNITKEGLYDCKVTVDKETYAFVIGSPVKTQMPSVEYISGEIENTLFNGISYVCSNRFSIKRIGSSKIIFIKENDYVSLKYVDASGNLHTILSYNDERKYFSLSKLYNISSFSDIDGLDDLKKAALDNVGTELEGGMLNKVAAMALIKTIKSNDSMAALEPTEITLINKRFVIVEFIIYGMKRHRAYVYDKEEGLLNIRVDIADYLDEISSTVHVDIDDIKRYVVDNRLGVNGSDEEPTYINHIDFMGNSIDVICLNGNMFLDDISDEDKEKAAKSFEELSNYAKRVSKKIGVSRSSVRELRKLSPKNVLGFCGLS